MHILAGKLKYKKINYKKDATLRPTRNIVRKSFFDTVAPIIKGSVFLDLFAGVGSMGLEALSRGAKKAIFVDNSFKSVEIIKRNLKEAGCLDSGVVMRRDAEDIKYAQEMKEVNLVYIDAPYDFDINSFLGSFLEHLNPEAIVCVEHARSRVLGDSFGEFSKFKVRHFGKSTLSYFGAGDE